MSNLNDLIEFPWVTEKTTFLQEQGKYFFRVRPEATKGQIKRAIEEIFNVHVVKINTIVMSGKKKRVRLHPGYTKDWKKAIVTLKEGEKIDYTA